MYTKHSNVIDWAENGVIKKIRSQNKNPKSRRSDKMKSSLMFSIGAVENKKKSCSFSHLLCFVSYLQFC